MIEELTKQFEKLYAALPFISIKVEEDKMMLGTYRVRVDWFLRGKHEIYTRVAITKDLDDTRCVEWLMEDISATVCASLYKNGGK